jgi:calmodulin
LQLTPDEIEQIKEIFEFIDADGSGVISREEAKPLFDRLHIGEDEIAGILEEMDKDNDGTIDLKEFMVLGKLLLDNGITAAELKKPIDDHKLEEKHLYTAEQLAQIRTIFDIVDTDGSGAIGNL